MSRTTARIAAMQMIFERISGGQGGEETLKMVYDELRAGKTEYPVTGKSMAASLMKRIVRISRAPLTAS